METVNLKFENGFVASICMSKHSSGGPRYSLACFDKNGDWYKKFIRPRFAGAGKTGFDMSQDTHQTFSAERVVEFILAVQNLKEEK